MILPDFSGFGSVLGILPEIVRFLKVKKNKDKNRAHFLGF
jgi:hypothetical protein